MLRRSSQGPIVWAKASKHIQRLCSFMLYMYILLALMQ